MAALGRDHLDVATTLQNLGAALRHLNATAAWCLSCLVNEKVALSDARVLAAFREREIVLVEADWTRRDAAISALLAAHGRSGVPLYLFYPPGGGAPVELPQILTPDLVVAAISGR